MSRLASQIAKLVAKLPKAIGEKIGELLEQKLIPLKFGNGLTNPSGLSDPVIDTRSASLDTIKIVEIILKAD